MYGSPLNKYKSFWIGNLCTGNPLGIGSGIAGVRVWVAIFEPEATRTRTRVLTGCRTVAALSSPSQRPPPTTFALTACRTSCSCKRNAFAATSTPPHPHPHALLLDPDFATSTLPTPLTTPTRLRPPTTSTLPCRCHLDTATRLHYDSAAHPDLHWCHLDTAPTASSTPAPPTHSPHLDPTPLAPF
ncbi:hypothetical protein EDB84DRAFT_1443289 [Lactarius hengduanensis]|nr:hypothetical protein EDB84DRAFT_1443289 [Lactarius hengduanensis]